jgi:hypothetical protein
VDDQRFPDQEALRAQVQRLENELRRLVEMIDEEAGGDEQVELSADELDGQKQAALVWLDWHADDIPSWLEEKVQRGIASGSLKASAITKVGYCKDRRAVFVILRTENGKYRYAYSKECERH